jgi:hypothetical protein
VQHGHKSSPEAIKNRIEKYVAIISKSASGEVEAEILCEK